MAKELSERKQSRVEKLMKTDPLFQTRVLNALGVEFTIGDRERVRQALAAGRFTQLGGVFGENAQEAVDAVKGDWLKDDVAIACHVLARNDPFRGE